MLACVPKQVDYGSHAFEGNHRSTMAGVARLAAPSAAAFRPAAPLPLPARQAVGRRWLRGDRRALVAQRELPFQIGNVAILWVRQVSTTRPDHQPVHASNTDQITPLLGYQRPEWLEHGLSLILRWRHGREGALSEAIPDAGAS